MARISSQWPSNMMETSVASSNHRSTSIHPSSVATDAPNATSKPMEMSSIMPGCRDRSSSHPPRRKTGPPHANTKVPNSGATRISSAATSTIHCRTAPEYSSRCSLRSVSERPSSSIVMNSSALSGVKRSCASRSSISSGAAGVTHSSARPFGVSSNRLAPS